MDAMERRQMLSNAPLAAISRRQVHADVAATDRADAVPRPADVSRPALRFLNGRTPLRASRPGPRGGVVGVEQQAAVANTFLTIADSVLRDVGESSDAARPAVSQVRQRLASLVENARSEPSLLVSATDDDVLESILDTFGPGDPFASLDVVSTDSLKPGDIILRCTDSLGSQAIELAHWSRYSHVALYIGNGQIIDAMPSGVHTRSLADLLSDSSRASVLRVPDLTASQAQAVIRAAAAKEGSAYNFVGLAALEAQKVVAVVAHAGEGLGGVIGVLSRAERLPAALVDNGTFACSQLVRYAFLKAGVKLTNANGVAPGDFVRLGMVGVLDEVGRLEVPTEPSTATGAWLP